MNLPQAISSTLSSPTSRRFFLTNVTFVVYSHMNYRSTPFQSATSSRKSFVRNTYRLPFPQPLYNQHLQAPLASVHSKGVITPAESILTDSRSYNLFRINTYEKQGGGGPPCQNFPLLRKSFRVDAGHELHGVLVVDLFQDFVV